MILCGLKNVVVELGEGRTHLVGCEFGECSLLTGVSHLGCERLVGKDVEDGVGHLGGIAGGNQSSGVGIIDDLWQSTGSASDDGFAGEHGFDCDHSESFDTRRDGEQRALLHEGGDIVAMTEELDVVFEL